MSVTTPIATGAGALPLGTWTSDPTHSSASFAVKHMVIATFRGRFEQFDAALKVTEQSAELVGQAAVDSLQVKDENLQAHLASPDFFDAERYPQITFRATDIARQGDELSVNGELTIKGHSHPVTARGTISGPAVTLGDVTKLGLTLETVVDRTQFGLNWNADLPKGGRALADEVKLTVELELVQG